MNAMKQETHRPGALKQSNKQHKTGRHRSKSAVNKELKGKQNIKTSLKHVKKGLQRDARRNQLLQIRKKKREEVLAQKRDLGGSLSAPVLICIIPLHSDIDIQNVMSVITSIDETANIATSPCGITHIGVPKMKQRFSIIVPPIGNVLATLDAAKVANTILFITSVACRTNGDTEKEIIDNWGKEIIVSCLAQGLPTTVFAVHNIQRLHIKESLESEYIPDPMDAEQTWPTEEELAEAAANRKRKIVKVVPKGTSEYQAAWIPDEDGADSNKDLEDDEEYETITMSEAAVDEEHYDQDIDILEEKQAMEKFKEAKLDAQFPDEVDTPQDILAKTRFQKYRGLESFRTSPWDLKENLPVDYSRIIEFADYDRRRKHIYRECKLIEEPIWYERYFHPDSTVVASMYAPVTFSPCPVLCYIENKGGELELIATGNVLSCNPNRIVLKRAVLSGHPYKVNKRSVVVRFMFFNCEDIEWFKPIQLRTKYGRRGHIKESLGN
ncbi:pre-rrna-processing protein tsr1-like protein [Lasius niger]|uniref:Pre-rRNA-processing protein TSR1 homolog n=1 Tax=Lasius niger TaxID=67767 RepID=A0A0J7KQA8_LASNI|nr:pre-rrna-processing protein tsr1-like protein [Lasius niger]